MVGRRGTEGEGESILSRLHAQQEGQKSPARGSEIISKRVRIQGHSLGEEGGATLVSTLGIQYSMASAVR